MTIQVKNIVLTSEQTIELSKLWNLVESRVDPKSNRFVKLRLAMPEGRAIFTKTQLLMTASNLAVNDVTPPDWVYGVLNLSSQVNGQSEEHV
jgi:hypothetical protein